MLNRLYLLIFMLLGNAQAFSQTAAYNFTLPDQHNQFHSLSDFCGKYVLLDFWATWCAPCKLDMQRFPDVVQQHCDSVVFISICGDDSLFKMVEYLDKKDFDWLFLFDNDPEGVLSGLQIKGYPTYMLIDPGGNILLPQMPGPFLGLEKQLREWVYKP